MQTASQGQTKTGYYALTDAQRKGLASGGSILPTLQEVFSTLNPQFATTKLGGLLAQLGVTPGMQNQIPPEYQAIVDQGLARATAHAETTRQQREQEAFAQLMAQMAQQTGGVGSG